MARQYHEMEKENMPLAEREKLTLAPCAAPSLTATWDTGSFMSGQVAGMLHECQAPA